jgi:cation diffusion facilitator family transporter
MALLASTALVNLGVVWYERRQGRRLQSQLLTADAAHTAGDVWVTLLAFASLLLTRAGWAHADAVLAIIVAVVIAWNGWGILRETVPILVDARAVDADEVRAAIAGIAGVRDVRRIRSRTAATGARFVEVTIGVAGDATVAASHELADRVEQVLRDDLAAGDVVVHVEPA